MQSSGSHLAARLRCFAACLAGCYRIGTVRQIKDLDSSLTLRRGIPEPCCVLAIKMPLHSFSRAEAKSSRFHSDLLLKPCCAKNTQRLLHGNACRRRKLLAWISELEFSDISFSRPFAGLFSLPQLKGALPKIPARGSQPNPHLCKLTLLVLCLIIAFLSVYAIFSK